MISCNSCQRGGGIFIIEEVRRFAKMWLESRKVDAILGLRESDGHVAPYLFRDWRIRAKLEEFYKKFSNFPKHEIIVEETAKRTK